eukprot:2708050-Rhodomonas_salina.2
MGLLRPVRAWYSAWRQLTHGVVHCELLSLTAAALTRNGQEEWREIVGDVKPEDEPAIIMFSRLSVQPVPELQWCAFVLGVDRPVQVRARLTGAAKSNAFRRHFSAFCTGQSRTWCRVRVG